MQCNLYPITYICGIKNLHNPLQHRIILPFIFLADQFNVPQFAKVEVSLLLQIFNSKFQYIDLPKGISKNISTKHRIQYYLFKRQGPQSSQKGVNKQSTSEATKIGAGKGNCERRKRSVSQIAILLSQQTPRPTHAIPLGNSKGLLHEIGKTLTACSFLC